MGITLYAIWVKIDDTLPWIELKETYQTRGEAGKAAEEVLKNAGIKLAKVAEKGKRMKALATVRQTKTR